MDKKCSSCAKAKPASEFQKRAASQDGLTASCKTCLRARDAARYPKERRRRLLLMKAYSETSNGQRSLSASRRAWVERNAVKRAAHIITGNAIRDGRLVKGECEKCGTKSVQAHHDDYEKPLSVRWLCVKHHREHHKTESLK